MFLTALKVKLVALVTVAGLNTDEMQNPSRDFVATLDKLAADQKKAADPKTGQGTDVNASFNTALAEIRKLAQAGDKDALYALAHWGVLSNSNVNEIIDLYRKASAAGQILAKAELAQVLIQAFPQDPDRAKEAVDLIKEGEKADNKVARRLLANLYLAGAPGVTKSVDEARKLLEKGSAAGDGEATLGLSQLYAADIPGIGKDPEKSLEYLKKATEQKNAVAMSTYAARMFDGDPADKNGKVLVQKNPEAAMKMFQDAADAGFAAANRLLGAIYENGLGGNAKNIKKAVEYYTKAANGNDAQALFRLGNFFEAGVKDGEGEKAEVVVQQNAKSALDLYRLAAQNNLAEGFYNVGVYYETGTVVDKDPAKAYTYHLKAANAGLPQAMHRLAGLYQNGTGVAQDLVAASGWYRRAAEGGYAASQIAYGQMLESGAEGRPQYTGAMTYYNAAADQGAPLAMLRIASLWERGLAAGKETPTPELARALAYAMLAVDASNSAELAVKYRDELQAKMTTEQKNEAKKIYDEKKKVAPATGAAAPAPAAAPAAPAPAPAPAPTKGNRKSKNN